MKYFSVFLFLSAMNAYALANELNCDLKAVHPKFDGTNAPIMASGNFTLAPKAVDLYPDLPDVKTSRALNVLKVKTEPHRSTDSNSRIATWGANVGINYISAVQYDETKKMKAAMIHICFAKYYLQNDYQQGVGCVTPAEPFQNDSLTNGWVQGCFDESGDVFPCSKHFFGEYKTSQDAEDSMEIQCEFNRK